jgi:hypothetical protein
MDDLPERLDRKAQYTDRYFDNASLGEMYRVAAAEIRRLREQVAELEAELGYHGIYPNPIKPCDTKGDSHEDMKPTA